MSAFGGLILTNRGRDLQAKAQLGTALVFTRMGIGDGELGSNSIPDLTALIHEVRSLTLGRIQLLTGGKARIGTIITNQGLATGFYWRELGIFATDPDLGEILYCYGNSGALAEYIPAGGGADIIEKWIDVITLIANATSVSAAIDDTLIFATEAELAAHINATDPHPQYTTGVEVTTAITNFPTTADPAQVPTSSGPGTLSQWVSWFANRIKAITGKTNWWETPSKTLEDVNTHLADYTLQVPFGGTTTNAGNAYSLATPVIAALVAGMAVCVKINADSTGATTLNWGGQGAKSIKKANGNAVTNLKANGIYTLRYDGTNFILQGEGGSGNATASDLLSGKTASVDAGDIIGTLEVTTTSGAQSFTSSGTFTVPDNVYKINAMITAGGAAGGRSRSGIGAGWGAGGGASGATGIWTDVAVTPGQTFTVTIGVGGIGNLTDVNGPSGTASSVGSMVANPGTGGLYATGNYNATGGTTGTAPGATYVFGQNGQKGGGYLGGKGGASFWPAPGDQSDGNDTGVGKDATGYGNGGGGAYGSSDYKGGNGSGGKVVIWW